MEVERVSGRGEDETEDGMLIDDLVAVWICKVFHTTCVSLDGNLIKLDDRACCDECV